MVSVTKSKRNWVSDATNTSAHAVAFKVEKLIKVVAFRIGSVHTQTPNNLQLPVRCQTGQFPASKLAHGQLNHDKNYFNTCFLAQQCRSVADLEMVGMLLKRGMGNGEWGMGNEEWEMGNGEWGMGN